MTQLQEYTLKRIVGKGAFGVVYHAEDNLGRPVAVKQSYFTEGEEAKLFEQEAQLLGRLHHYSVPTLYRYFHDKDVPYMAMSWAPGHRLSQIIQMEDQGGVRKPLDPEHTCWVMDRIMEGLQYLHLNRIIHGDVKPDNIMVCVPRHSAMVIDLTVAVANSHAGSVGIGGTPGFIPPEILSRLPPMAESDIWSAGKVWIAMLGGDPYVGLTPPHVPSELKDFLNRMLDPNPLARPSSAGEVRYWIRTFRKKHYLRTSTLEVLKYQDGQILPHPRKP